MTEPAGPGWRTERIGVLLVGAVVILGFLALLFWWAVFVVIRPGQAGVLYDLFRGTRPGVYAREGLKVKFPWNQMYIYDTRLRTEPNRVHALSREGMILDLDIAVLFRPRASELALLHREIGPAYAERVVAPVTVGVVREYFAQHDSHELYTVDARVLKMEIMAALRAQMGRYHIIVEDVVLERLIMPKAVLEAIEEKLTQEQRAAAYGFRLEAEKAEAQRLEIKGTALNRYYSLVNGALTPSLLTWRGIEATVELAQSPNSKVIVVGSGKEQLPIILGSDIHTLPEARPGRPGAATERRGAEPSAPRVSGPGADAPPPIAPGVARPPQIVPRP